MKITQGTVEWFEAKQSTIGASEIFSLCAHYCKKELESFGLNLINEKSFRTIQELFLKVKFNAKLSAIDLVNSEFGNGMESYIIHRLKKEIAGIEIEKTKDFVINKDLHPLAACSPDGYINITNGIEMQDFDKTCVINNSYGKGALELKTTNYFGNFINDNGCNLSYIFQNQFQMMVLGLKWGCIAMLFPKEKEYDEPFFKGRILEKVETLFKKECYSSETIDEFYNIKYYIYPELEAVQHLILKSLNLFQEALDKYDYDESYFPRNSENLSGLQREKKMWSQLWPEHAGILTLENHKLNDLLDERFQGQQESLFAEQSKTKIECEILETIKSSNMEKYCEIRGTNHRILWDKNGIMRFYKIKENVI